jgi:predicted nucleotidyltransferase
MFNYKERRALKEFKEKCFTLTKCILEIKVFGSRVRGDNEQDSDFDLFVVVNDGGLIEDKIIDIAFDINLKYDIYISPRVIPSSILNGCGYFGTTLKTGFHIPFGYNFS